MSKSTFRNFSRRQFLRGAGVATRPIDFTALLARDTLNSAPPALVAQLFKFASPFLKIFV